MFYFFRKMLALGYFCFNESLNPHIAGLDRLNSYFYIIGFTFALFLDKVSSAYLTTLSITYFACVEQLIFYIFYPKAQSIGMWAIYLQ